MENQVSYEIDYQLETKLKNYERVAKQFSQFFDEDELGQIIDRKADVELINRLNVQKADNSKLHNLE